MVIKKILNIGNNIYAIGSSKDAKSSINLQNNYQLDELTSLYKLLFDELTIKDSSFIKYELIVSDLAVNSFEVNHVNIDSKV